MAPAGPTPSAPGKPHANKSLKSLLTGGGWAPAAPAVAAGPQLAAPPPPPEKPAPQAASSSFITQLIQRYFGGAAAGSGPRASRSAPCTPVKQAGRAASGGKPQVRFADANSNSSGHSQRSHKVRPDSNCSESKSQTGSQGAQQPAGDLIERLFGQGDGQGECPMDSRRFRRHGYALIDYICDYLEGIGERRVTPVDVEPGYLKSLIAPAAPQTGEPFAQIMRDFEEHIMRGITHWQHPHFHAYFPAGRAFPSILADMLGDALGCVGFSWAASPAYTELEIIMLDWMGKLIGLPDEFLCLSRQDSKGGGVIQGSASECVLVNLLAARHWAIDRLRKRSAPNTPDTVLLGKLIGYCSREAHSCVEKAAMIGFIRMRALDTDEHHSLRGPTLEAAIRQDLAAGLEPFLVCATLGTTSCCSFDNLAELGEVCQRHDLWLHVDAAYAGSALICDEFKHLAKGLELASSFNMNPNKWLLINFDCSLMWVKDRFKLTRAFVVDPLYLQHSFSDQAIDYRHWGVPLSRRFRALKLWFVIRNYGADGLRAYIRNHVQQAKLFEGLLRSDARFLITNQVVLGLVCFRLLGSNALNQRLLSMINASGKLHMVPASLNGRYVIRFCVCDQNAKAEDIKYAFTVISDTASELLAAVRAGRERVRAVSQQNTIDVSDMSLHTQQSASADRLAGADQQPGSAAAAQQVSGRKSPASANSNSNLNFNSNSNSAERGPLTKQASVQAEANNNNNNNNNKAAELGGVEENKVMAMYDDDDVDDVDDLVYEDEDVLHEDEDEQLCARGAPNEAVLEAAAAALARDSAASGGRSPEAAAGGAGRARAEWRSALAARRHQRPPRGAEGERRGQAAAGGPQPEGAHADEAADELQTLAASKARASLRYKREFFVRVVSDPRVYRASISGDINAGNHTSSCSLAEPELPAGVSPAAAGGTGSAGAPRRAQ